MFLSCLRSLEIRCRFRLRDCSFLGRVFFLRLLSTGASSARPPIPADPLEGWDCLGTAQPCFPKRLSANCCFRRKRLWFQQFTISPVLALPPLGQDVRRVVLDRVGLLLVNEALPEDQGCHTDDTTLDLNGPPKFAVDPRTIRIKQQLIERCV